VIYFGGRREGRVEGGRPTISISEASFLLIGILCDTQSFRLINPIISGVSCYFHDYFAPPDMQRQASQAANIALLTK
jgi:hypothetical protein